jgi:type I restriction enzyme S subunit
VHWPVVQSRRYFANRNEKAHPEDKQLTASQKHGVVYQAEFMELEGQKVMQVIVGADILKHAEPNDFVISMRSFQGGIEWCGLRGSISSAYVMLVPKQTIWSPFYRFLFKSTPYIQALQATTNLVRDGQALRFSNFAQVPLPLPPVTEQQYIATFLDRETAKIDALIAEQEKLLTLLAEKRQATISRAVTKGLNPNATMKDSGVAWLGEVPEHWELKPMRYVSDLNPAISFDGISELDELTFLPMEQIKGGYYLPNTAPLAKYNSSYSTFDRGDILLAKVTPCFENGNIAISGEKGFGTSEIFVLRPQGIEPRVLFWYLQSAYFKMDGEASMTGAGGLKRVTTEVIRRHIVPTPPPNEQSAIATFLDRETSRLDTLKAKSERAIALLKERRSALIAAAVTGQIDVRGLVSEPETA